MDSVAEPHQIVRFGGSLAGNSSIRWKISATESNGYGSTPVRNHSGSEAACEKPALIGKMFKSEAAAGLSTGNVRQANRPVHRKVNSVAAAQLNYDVNDSEEVPAPITPPKLINLRGFFLVENTYFTIKPQQQQQQQ